MAEGPDTTTTPTVHDLRRRWKPTKQRLGGSAAHEPLLIRIHRCCSWLQRVEDLTAADGNLDSMLIFRWIALSSLYSRWDAQARQPLGERETLAAFLARVLDCDVDGRVGGVLKIHRKLVMSVFDDSYLTKHFWEHPSKQRALKAEKTKYDARTWYHEKRYGLILERLLDRIYFLRCQLVHGGATAASRLNRTAVRRCATMLGHLLPAFLLVIVDHGVDEDWGPLCYPPVS